MQPTVNFYLDKIVAGRAGYQEVSNALAGVWPCLARKTKGGKFVIYRLCKKPKQPNQEKFEFLDSDNLDFLLAVHG